MDISFKIDDMKFNFRVAVIIKNKDKILVHHDEHKSHYTLPGGRVSLDEDTNSAIKREVKEEMGADICNISLKNVIENFFVSSYNGKKYHELLFVYSADFEDKELYEKEIKCIEAHKLLKFLWLKIEDIKKLEFKPEIILDFLESDELIHSIFREESSNEISIVECSRT